MKRCLDFLKSLLLFPVSNNSISQPCYVCPLAKQHRLPFVSANKFSESTFDLIHCDIWGPYKTPSYQGHRFFLTLVDDKSRFCWIFLMKCKSEVHSIIPRFCAYVYTQFSSAIKLFRSDNARELSFTEYFSKNGILHQYSCVETP